MFFGLGLLGLGVLFVAAIGGLDAAAHGVFASGVGLTLFSLISGEFTRTLPFTRKPLKKDTSSMGLMFGAMAWQNWEALQRTNRGY